MSAKDRPGILIARLRIGTHPSRTHAATYTHSLVVGRPRDGLSIPSGHPSKSSWSDGIDSTAKARSGRRERAASSSSLSSRGKDVSRQRASPTSVMLIDTRERLESRFDLSFPLFRPRSTFSPSPVDRSCTAYAPPFVVGRIRLDFALARERPRQINRTAMLRQNPSIFDASRNFTRKPDRRRRGENGEKGDLSYFYVYFLWDSCYGYRWTF